MSVDRHSVVAPPPQAASPRAHGVRHFARNSEGSLTTAQALRRLNHGTSAVQSLLIRNDGGRQ